MRRFNPCIANTSTAPFVSHYPSYALYLFAYLKYPLISQHFKRHCPPWISYTVFFYITLNLFFSLLFIVSSDRTIDLITTSDGRCWPRFCFFLSTELFQTCFFRWEKLWNYRSIQAIRYEINLSMTISDRIRLLILFHGFSVIFWITVRRDGCSSSRRFLFCQGRNNECRTWTIIGKWQIDTKDRNQNKNEGGVVGNVPSVRVTTWRI